MSNSKRIRLAPEGGIKISNYKKNITMLLIYYYTYIIVKADDISPVSHAEGKGFRLLETSSIPMALAQTTPETSNRTNSLPIYTSLPKNTMDSESRIGNNTNTNYTTQMSKQLKLNRQKYIQSIVANNIINKLKDIYAISTRSRIGK